MKINSLHSNEKITEAKFIVVVCTRAIDSVNFWRTIEFLENQEWPPESALCVVSNSDQQIVELDFFELQHLLPVPVWLTRETKPGYASVRNEGLRACSQAQALLFLDDDTIIETGWIMKMWSSHISQPLALLGSLHDRLESLPDSQAETDKAALQVRQRGGATLSGSNGLLIPYLTLGDYIFSGAFNKSGGEDTDLLLRLSLVGHEVIPVDSIALEIDRLLNESWKKDAMSAFHSGQQWVFININYAQPVTRLRIRALAGVLTACVTLTFSVIRPKWYRRRQLRLLSRRLGVLSSF